MTIIPDIDFKQVLSPLEQISQQARALQTKTTEVFNGLTQELVGAGQAVMGAAGAALSSITGFISGGEAAFSNFINRIAPNELLLKRSGLATFKQAADVIGAAKASGTDLRFPLSPSDSKYKMRLSFREYVRPSALSPPTIQRKNSIVLPIPMSGMQENHSINYSQNDTGLLGAITNTLGGNSFEAGQSSLRKLIDTGDWKGGWDAANKRLTELDNIKEGDVGGGTKAALINLAKKYGMKYISNDLYDLSTQIMGEIPNPHPTILFRGVNLRTYQFTFRFAPTSRDESVMLRKIINKLKACSLPKYSQNSDKNLLKYPMIVYPEFIVPGNYQVTQNGAPGALAKSLPFGFKYCVIEAVNVNYAPTGSAAFFQGGKGETAFIQMDLVLREIEVQTSEDYEGGGSGDGINSPSFANVGDLIDSFTQDGATNPSDIVSVTDQETDNLRAQMTQLRDEYHDPQGLIQTAFLQAD